MFNITNSVSDPPYIDTTANAHLNPRHLLSGTSEQLQPQIIGQSESQGQAWHCLLKAFLNTRPFPLLVMNSDLCVYVLNDIALKTLPALGLDLSDTSKLQFASKVDRMHFTEACQAVLTALQEPSPEGSAQVLRHDTPEGGRYIISLSPLAMDPTLQPPSGPVDEAQWLVVSIKPTLSDLHICPKRLVKIFDLTPAEANLVVALAQGLSLQDYAVLERRKISTVRWHLQNVFERTETRSQAQLIRMVASIFT